MEKDKGQKLQFSCEKIELDLENNRAEGRFRIRHTRGKILKGHLICLDPRLQCYPISFEQKEVEVHLDFQGENEPVEEIEGRIICISEAGEASLPYVIYPNKSHLESSLGEIRDLFHFTNLARSNWNEAVKLFFHPQFIKILQSSRGEERELYRGLSATGNEQCVEEFLLAVHKKNPMVYRVENTLLQFKNLEHDEKKEVRIQREGWGYTRAYLTAEGGFLFLEKDCLLEADFLGNFCELPIYLQTKRMHQGKNYGAIHLTHAYGRLTIQIIVEQNQHHRMKVAIEKRRKMKEMKVRLTELYIDFRTKRTPVSRWRKETQQLLEKMRILDERDPRGKLFMAHLQISSDKPLDGRWILERAGKLVNEDKDPLAYAYYLYLTTLLGEKEEYQRWVGSKVEELYAREKNSWELAWLMLHLSPKFYDHDHTVSSTAKKWNFLMEIFAAGCASPVLYTEAVMLLNFQPTLLMELGQVELRILRFGQSRCMLSDEVKGILQYLSFREQEYSDALFKLLEIICLTDDSPGMLQSLCSLLIKGDKQDSSYFPWYEWAVTEGLKITRLYEYYLLSLDRSRETKIPRIVLLYFSYETSLNHPNAAYLYRYVHERREEMEELYLNYAPKIERFMLKQLHLGKLDKDLGYLYEQLLIPDMLTPDNAKALERIMFKHGFLVEPKEDERIIIIHRHLKEEQLAEVTLGQSFVDLFGRNYLLFRESQKGERFLLKKEEYPKPFLHLSALSKTMGIYIREGLGLSLSLCEEDGGWQPIQKENEEHFAFLSECEQIIDEERCILRSHLLDYYEEKGRTSSLDEWLEECTLDALGEGNRGKLVQVLISRGYYQKAYQLVLAYGPEGIDPKALVRVVTYMLEEESWDEQELLWIAAVAFRKGKYNPALLNFLSKHYQGSIAQLMELFHAVKTFEGEVYGLSERILKQMLFTKTYDEGAAEVFKAYVAGGAKTPLESQFLTWCAKDYLAGIQEIDGYFIKDILRVYGRNTKLHFCTHLACLKYFADYPMTLEEKEEGILREFLREAVRKRLYYFPFLQSYKEYPEWESLSDQQMLFYQAEAGEEVVLHYRKKGRGKEDEAFQEQPMERLKGQLASFAYVLFPGEELDYYLTTVKENQEYLRQRGILKRLQEETFPLKSRYGMISRIAEAASQQDYLLAEQLLEEYLRWENLVEQGFQN